MRTLILLSMCSFLLAAPVQGQDTLRLEDAVSLGLENNYAIRLVQQDLKIAENNVSRGNAGFLPRIDANIGQDWSEQNISARFITDDVLESKGAGSNNFVAGVQLNWTLFDGMRMFTTYEKLQELEQMGETQARINIQNTLAAILTTYYDMVRQSLRIRVWQESLQLSQARASLSEEKFALGSASKRETLLAQVDVNADRSELLRQENQLLILGIQLNRLLGRDPAIEFAVETAIDLQPRLPYRLLEEQLFAQNPALLLTQQAEQVAALEWKEVQAERFPVVGTNLGYNYNRSVSEAGFLLSNQVLGLNAGLSVNLTLFDGLNLERRLQNASINRETTALQTENMQHQLLSDFLVVYQEYENALNLLELERENLSVSRQNLEIARQTYEIGELSSIEFREAQRNHVQSETRLIEALYLVKVNEIELQRLSGNIRE